MWQFLSDALSNPFVASIVGAGVTWVGHRVVGAARWAGIVKTANVILKDPAKTNDPREAVAQALIEAQLARVVEATKRVEQAFVVNGSNQYPKQ